MENQPLVSIHQLKLYRSGFKGALTLGFLCNTNQTSDAQLQSFLCPDEIQHYQSLTNLKRIAFFNGRYIAKRCLSYTIPGIRMQDLSITNGIFGQPLLSGNADLHLSISHNDQASACIIFPRSHPMGLDIQKLQYDNTSAIKSQLTTEECEIDEYFYTHLWASKEALSKILQTGLLIPFSVLEVRDIEFLDGFVINYFKNFWQYKAISFQWQDYICAIVLPANTHLDMPVLLKELSGKHQFYL